MPLDFNLGWNAGARTTKLVAADCEATFNPVVPTTDIYVGLCGTVAFTGSFGGFGGSEFARNLILLGAVMRLTHSFRFAKENDLYKAYVYELGVLKHTFSGVFDGTNVFKLRRVGGVVTYYKDNVLGYTSATASIGIRWVEASIYMGGDSI